MANDQETLEEKMKQKLIQTKLFKNPSISGDLSGDGNSITIQYEPNMEFGENAYHRGFVELETELGIEVPNRYNKVIYDYHKMKRKTTEELIFTKYPLETNNSEEDGEPTDLTLPVLEFIESIIDQYLAKTNQTSSNP